MHGDAHAIVWGSPWSPPWGTPASTLFFTHSQTDPFKIWIRHHHFSAQSLSAAPIPVLLWLMRPKAPHDLASADISGATFYCSLPHSFSHSLVATPWACHAHSCSKAVVFASPLLPGTLSPASSWDLLCTFHPNVTYQTGLPWPLYIRPLKSVFLKVPFSSFCTLTLCYLFHCF